MFERKSVAGEWEERLKYDRSAPHIDAYRLLMG